MLLCSGPASAPYIPSPLRFEDSLWTFYSTSAARNGKSICRKQMKVGTVGRLSCEVQENDLLGNSTSPPAPPTALTYEQLFDLCLARMV